MGLGEKVEVAKGLVRSSTGEVLDLGSCEPGRGRQEEGSYLMSRAW